MVISAKGTVPDKNRNTTTTTTTTNTTTTNTTTTTTITAIQFLRLNTKMLQDFALPVLIIVQVRWQRKFNALNF